MFTNESILYPLAYADEKVRLLSHCTGTLLPRRLLLTVQQCCRQRAPILVAMNAEYINQHVMLPKGGGAPAYGLALHPHSSVCALKLRHKPSCQNPFVCLPLIKEKAASPIIYGRSEMFIVFRSFQLTIQVRTLHCSSNEKQTVQADNENKLDWDEDFKIRRIRSGHPARIVCFVNKTNVGIGAGLYSRSLESGKMELRGILDKSVRMPHKDWMYEFVDIFELLPWLEQFKHDDLDYFRLISDVQRSKWKEVNDTLLLCPVPHTEELHDLFDHYFDQCECDLEY
ncbi:hypothetical protein ACOME3_009067 [Neoechinorhynchus agilis]